jgi:hypothetical protein
VIAFDVDLAHRLDRIIAESLANLGSAHRWSRRYARVAALR